MDAACGTDDVEADDAATGGAPCERSVRDDDTAASRNLGIQARWRRDGRTLPGPTAEAADVDAKLLDALVDAVILADWPNEGLKNSSPSGAVAMTLTLDPPPLLLLSAC